MKNRKLSFRLNVIHISQFSILLTVILVVNIFLAQEVIYHNIKDILVVNGQKLNSSINDKIESIEQSSDFIVKNISKDITIESQIIEAVELNPLIKHVEIVDLKHNNNRWNVELYNDSIIRCRYYQKINNDYELEVSIIDKWFDVILNGAIVIEPSDFNIFNRNFSVHITSDLMLVDNGFNFNDINIFTEIDEKGKFIDKISYKGSNELYYSHVSHIPKLGLYLSVNQSYNQILEYLGRYPAFISLFLIFIIILTFYLIIRTNINYARPYSEILNSFENTQTSNYHKNINEAKLIKRKIEQLQNQLNFYVNNLKKTSSENKKIENDLKIAKKLQSNILPTDTLEISKRQEFSISAMSEAAYDIGGDLYDYYLVDDNHLLFVVGDISGKGIPAALFMIYTQTLLRSIAKSEMKVSDIIEQLNNKLIEENISDLFVTMFLAILNIKTGVLSYCNAAHNLPLIITQEGSVDELEETHGIPIGIYANRKYKYSEVELNPKDQILIYTDGLTDTIDENGMNYSIDVLKYNLMGTWFQPPKEALNKIQKSVIEFRGNIDPVDDMTILFMQFNNKVNI